MWRANLTALGDQTDSQELENVVDSNTAVDSGDDSKVIIESSLQKYTKIKTTFFEKEQASKLNAAVEKYENDKKEIEIRTFSYAYSGV